MPYYASADWLRELGALDDKDIESLKKVREHRNFVAHNTPSIVMEAGIDVDPALLAEVVRLVKKRDQWWLRYIQIPCNPDLDDMEMSDELLARHFS